MTSLEIASSAIGVVQSDPSLAECSLKKRMAVEAKAAAHNCKRMAWVRCCRPLGHEQLECLLHNRHAASHAEKLISERASLVSASAMVKMAGEERNWLCSEQVL